MLSLEIPLHDPAIAIDAPRQPLGFDAMMTVLGTGAPGERPLFGYSAYKLRRYLFDEFCRCFPAFPRLYVLTQVDINMVLRDFAQFAQQDTHRLISTELVRRTAMEQDAHEISYSSTQVRNLLALSH